MKKSLFLFFLLICTLFFFRNSAAEEDLTVEESFIFIRVNNTFGDPFFRVYMTSDGKKIYIPLRSLIEFTGIQTLEVDTADKTVSGSVITLDSFDNLTEEKFLRSYAGTRYIERDEDIFVDIQNLKSVMKLKDLFWDENRSYLVVELDYLLPFQVKDINEQKKYNLNSNLESEKEKVIQPERKIFSPGVLRLEYFLSDFEDRGTQNFSALYNNQLLYGDFSIQSSFYPETELDLITLKYRDKLDGKLILLGDTSLEKNNALSLKDSNVRGFNIINDGIYTEVDSRKVTIKGPVVNGTTVELYQSDILIGLQVVTTSNEYSFEDITLFGYSDDFVLKFYYPNGRIEERSINTISDYDIQEKGKSDYSIQFGESDNSLAGSAKYLYGITDNITLGASYLKANSQDIEIDDIEESNEFNIAEGILIMRSRAQKNPTLYKFNWLADLDDTGEGTFRAKINKQLWFLDTELFYDEYSDEVTLIEESERRYGGLISTGLGRFSYNLGYEMREDLDGDERRYTFDTRYFPNDTTRLLLNNTYRDLENEEDEYRVRFSTSYSGFKSFNINLRANGTYSDGEWGDEEYSIGIAKKYREFKKNDLDYSAEVKYSSEEWQFTLYFSYYFTDWLSVPARFTQDDQEVGIAVEKTFILSRLFKESGNPEPEEAWLEGFVFRDDNGNNTKDPGEEYFEGIEVIVGPEKTFTDKNGYYYIDGVEGNFVQEVKPGYQSVDPLLRFTQEKYKIRPIPATGHRLDIPLVPIFAIIGDIELGNTDLPASKRARIFQQTKIYIKNGDEIISSNTAESDGFFIIENIIPGKYTVEAKYLGDEDLYIENNSYDLQIQAGETGDYYEDFNFKLLENVDKKATSKI